MYKVFFVDDEFYSRQALKLSLDWEAYGCTVCGEANNGQAGLEKIREIHPDIVFADINMPIMDGLEMIAHVQQEFPEILCVIITGYTEFEYAKRGIELGIQYFIVKPVDDAEIASTVKEIVRNLDLQFQKEQEYRSLQFWADKNMALNRQRFLHFLIEGTPTLLEEAFQYECENLKLPLQQGGYSCWCLNYPDHKVEGTHSPEQWEALMENFLLSQDLQIPFVVFQRDESVLFFVFSRLERQQWEEEIVENIVRRFQVVCMREFMQPVEIGIGTWCASYTEIAASARSAEQKLKSRGVSQLVGQMLQYIHEHYDDTDLTLYKIAAELFANYSYLSAQFTREIGMTVSQYILKVRVTRAVELLRKGESNMFKIAEAVGYLNVKYFYRCFKKELGVTPYQFLEQQKKTE